LTLFPSERLNRPAGLQLANSPAPLPSRVPQFIVPQDPIYSNLWESLKAFFQRVKLPPSRNPILFRRAILVRPRASRPPFEGSILVHCLFIWLLFYLHQAFPATVVATAFVDPRPDRIYYRVPVVDQSKALQHIELVGSTGGTPSRSAPDPSPAASGSAASQNRLLIVSRPVHPDNFHQTIYQPSSPPDIRITSDLKLPNIVLQPPQLVKPKITFNPDQARPVTQSRDLKADAAPTVKQATPQLSALETPMDHPQLAIPLAAASAPQARSGKGTGTEADAPSIEAANNAAGLVVIGTNPAGPTAPVVLPPGNRWGEFSTSPSGAGSSSGSSGVGAGGPGGLGSSAEGAKSGSGGGGGEGSAGGSVAANSGAGSGTGNGGSGNSGFPGHLSIGGSESGDAGGALGAALPSALVYPVTSHLNIRRNSLVISTGPMGGGGLDAYGILKCGKIYTIYLPMPGKSWTMQYCQKTTGAERPSESRSPVVHLESGLTPPDPDIENRFDFRRLPVPPEKALKMILLKGTLGTDGTINDLAVFQGVLPAMDEAARIAFGRWKFKPAVRGGKAVAVEILVGVPVSAPSTGQN
jgi:Gram-negative bacterial TonB protein C-terminal